MLERLNEPVAFFLLIMGIILVTPLLSQRVRLPGIIGIILGGMLIGPQGFHLIEAGDRMEFLSTIGLVYLMFSAGLEVDIRQFMRVRGRSIVFGFFTFLLPQLMGMGLGRILGLDWLGTILLGSAFASRTLIAFPLLTRLGVTRNEAIAVTTGATVPTDIGAFIILAVVLGARTGGLNDEVIWGSERPVMVGKLAVPLNATRWVVFLLPPKAVPHIALRRMLEANLSIAKALNVPLVLRADSGYLQSIEALRVAIDTDHPMILEPLKDQLKPAALEQESISSFMVVPGFGSRQRDANTLGNLPEQLAASFDGNLAILHFDQ